MLIYIVVYCLLWVADARINTSEEQYEVIDFDVVVWSSTPLGVALGDKLQIQRFLADTKQAPGLPASAGLRVGDRIVRVNGRVVEGIALTRFAQMLRDTSRPVVLTFRPDDALPRAILDHMSPLTKTEALTVNGAHVDVFSGPVKHFTLPATEAEFSGASFCGTRSLAVPEPADACTRLRRNVRCMCVSFFRMTLRTQVRGAFVLIHRGTCTFLDKGKLT
jgi:hypothetical protein